MIKIPEDPSESCDGDDLKEVWPYCECEIEFDEEELASNVCKACGKPIT